ncbi:MAG TPA: glutathione S-transferase family protein [Pseudolabrys sp.]|nr:glutathione S-transferase family protein [Pseudolabrys sp.]
MFIYELPVSLYSFKLRLAIALKRTTVERRAPPGGTYCSAEFRAINPAGTIPALVDADFVLAESDAIVEYLDDIHAGAPLLPSEPRLRARTRMLSRWCDMRLEPHIRSLFPAAKAATRDTKALATADERITAALNLFEAALDNEGPYALGAQPGLADCGLTASVVWLCALTPVLSLSARPGEKLVRSVTALRNNAMVSTEVNDYQTLVGKWVAAL